MARSSFYHFVLTERGAGNEFGQFAEAVFLDLMFPRDESDYNQLSTYIEEYGTADMSLSTYDRLYEKYIEWLKF